MTGAGQGLLTSYPRSLAVALGAVSATGFAPLGLWPLTLGGIAGLLALLDRARSPRSAFAYGWFFGLGQFAVGLNWIAKAFTYQAELSTWLGGVAVVGIAIYLAIWVGLASLAGWWLAQRNRGELVLAMAGCWTLGEWLRGWVFTGFPWNPLSAVTLKSFANPGLAALAPWLGTYALSGLVMLLGGAWFLAIARGRPDWRGGALLLVPIALFLLPRPVDGAEGTVPYTLVQANLSQDTLHDADGYEQRFARAARLSRPLQPGAPRVVFWPESGVPDYLRDGYPAQYYAGRTWGADPAVARARMGRVIGDGALLLTGNDELEFVAGRLGGARNAMTAIDYNGNVRGLYFKSHLVPYGEYVPMKGLLEPLGLARFVPGDIEFWPGPGPQTIDLGSWGKAGVGICYEIIFPGAVVDRKNRPDYLFNPSNDGWYGDWGPPQHLAQTRLRAIEEGLPVIRATTTGISAVIDADGVVRESIPLRVAERRDGLIPPAHAPTLFARLGNGLSLGWAIALLVLSQVARRRRQG